MPRFLHTADWQIGRRYAQFAPEDAAPIAEQRIETVGRIARLATERHVDAVLVAGDVFDTQTVADRLIRQLFNAMTGFAGPWVLIPGNHDAALGESVWTRARRLDGAIPPQVRLVLEPGIVPIEECRTAVLAAPLTQRHTYNDTTAFFDEAQTPAGWLRIGLAHGSVGGVLADDIDSANPIAATRCASARLDYLALGDWHGLKQIDARCAYSGTPEAERFLDNDPGHCLIVEIDAPGLMPVIEAVRVGRYRWSSLVSTVAVPSDIDGIEARLAALGADDVVMLKVSGETDVAGRRRLDDQIGRAEAAARSLTADLADLRLLPTDEDLNRLSADGYLAEVIAELRRDQAGETGGTGGTVQAAVAREALAVLCRELDGRRRDGPLPAGGSA